MHNEIKSICMPCSMYAVCISGCDAQIRLCDDKDRLICEGEVKDGETKRFNIEKPDLWSAEKPYLYKLPSQAVMK